MSQESRLESLTEKQAASLLSMTVAAMRRWRNKKTGPDYIKLGRSVRYLKSDLDLFVQANRVKAVSDAD